MIENLTFRAPSELKARLRIEAKRKGLTLNAFLTQLAWQYFDKQDAIKAKEK